MDKEFDLYGKVPRDRITLNGWCRNFFLLNSIVSKAILFHAVYSIRMFRSAPASCFCLDVARRLNLIKEVCEKPGFWQPGSLLVDMAKEYWLFGEVFPYMEFDDSLGVWDKITIQNPDYVYVKRSIMGDHRIQLRPDEVLKRIVSSKTPEDAELKEQLPQGIVNCIKNNKYIPLDVFNISHIKRLAMSYDMRGTTIMLSVMKDLVMYDSLRELLASGNENKNYEACLKHVSDSICQGLLFSPGSLALLDCEHTRFRSQISDWLTDKVFKPLNQFAKGQESCRCRAVPQIEWQPASANELLAVLNDT